MCQDAQVCNTVVDLSRLVSYVFLTRNHYRLMSPKACNMSYLHHSLTSPKALDMACYFEKDIFSSIFSNIGSCILFFIPHIPYYVSTTHSAMLLPLLSSNLVDRL